MNYMTLQYLQTNQAYMFTFGAQGLRMGPDNRLIFATRQQAVEAAKWHGLAVDSKGEVK